MKSLFKKHSSPESHYQHRALCGVNYPHPAIEHGWLHGRELKLGWNIDRIAAKIGERCWLSYYETDQSAGQGDQQKQRLTALAGYWPTGGFIELLLHNINALEEHPRGILAVYAPDPATCETVFAELLAGYVHKDDPSVGGPRLGMLNEAYGDLQVQRIPITAEQTVPREQLDLFYGAGMSDWAGRWLELLQHRRYGLTVLTGAPGTGKTTLLRSLAQWLAGSHMFYFMPAARFTKVESGEIVTFWAEENRNSKLRKVLILEDAESVLQRRGEDNREKVASLLNLTDGMLGDALGLHVVCTLNCELADLDPALLRPGRLIAHREVGRLSVNEARQLAAHLDRPAPAGPATLAEIMHGSIQPTVPPRPAQRRLGFHAGTQA